MNTEPMKQQEPKRHRRTPLACLILFGLALAAGVIHLIGSLSPAFSDGFNRIVSAPIRAALAYLTAPLPFSLAESVILLLPVIAVVLIVVFIRRIDRDPAAFLRCMCAVLSIPAVFYTLFVFSFGLGYHTTTLDEKLGLERTPVTAEELADTMEIVVARLNERSNSVLIAPEDGSLKPYTQEEAAALCRTSYAALSEAYDFLPVLNVPVKRIALSDLMTYTHISGVYTYFTGEANLNTNYPDFVNVFTTAHEMAHQRGIARENEANFMAYLVCITSDDLYMQYAGYLNMFEYLAEPLYGASPTLYGKAIADLNVRVRYDLECYRSFFDRYRDNVAADVSDAVNHTYLVMQGEKEGSRSYGLVVDLAVAYHKAEP